MRRGRPRYDEQTKTTPGKGVVENGGYPAPYGISDDRLSDVSANGDADDRPLIAAPRLRRKDGEVGGSRAAAAPA